jgi:hypothetical protein
MSEAIYKKQPGIFDDLFGISFGLRRSDAFFGLGIWIKESGRYRSRS